MSRMKNSPNLSFEFYRSENFGKAIEKAPFDLGLSDLLKVPDVMTFSLKTIYPGLVIGSGYAHGKMDKSDTEAYQLGFYFDHTSGMPVIPGSSVKGTLRSVFPSYNESQESFRKKTDKDSLHQYIEFHLEKKLSHVQMSAFERSIFKYGDVFYDAFVSSVDSHLLASDYITPHKNLKGESSLDEFVDPIPVKFLKISPGVTFTFQFRLQPFASEGIEISVEDKLSLFKAILLDIGVGAKTNVGYGKLIQG